MPTDFLAPLSQTASERIERYHAIHDFLSVNEKIWQKEVIHESLNIFTNYSLSSYPADWTESISNFSHEELFKLPETYLTAKTLPESFKSFFSKINALTTIPDIRNTLSKLPSPAYQNLTPKKAHEIEEIFSLLSSKTLLPQQNSVVDFCGGAGYVARTLAHFCHTPALSIDIDHELQERGKRRQTRFIPEHAKTIEFTCRDLLKDYHETKQTIPHGTPFIGIHTCGHLSDIQIKLSTELQSKWTFNVGCCYFKTNDCEYNLSSTAKAKSIAYSTYALFLAARGHETNIKPFIFSQKVKTCRFLLHLFLKHEFNLPFYAVGSVPDAAYNDNHVLYILDRLKNLHQKGVIPTLSTQKTIDNFLKEPLIIRQAHYMRMCNYIRGQFSRVLELGIALDRGMFLDEHDYSVYLGKIFDPTISPRNIGILGIK